MQVLSSTELASCEAYCILGRRAAHDACVTICYCSFLGQIEELPHASWKFWLFQLLY